jgi:DNA-binding NarL/FixJ family response regulator
VSEDGRRHLPPGTARAANTGIADALVLTVGAVEKHIASILGKLDLPPSGSDHRRVLAVLTYLQEEPQV